MLKGKTVLIAVTGSIAAYKMADCARELTKQHAEVHVLMTRNATGIVSKCFRRSVSASAKPIKKGVNAAK